MRTKVIPILIIGALCMSACSTKEEVLEYELSPFESEQFTENVVLEVLGVNEDEINIRFTNLSDILYIYGIIPYIEINYNNEWHVVPTADEIAWTLEGYYIEPNSTCEQRIPIKHAYDLAEGDYRLIVGIIDESKTPTSHQDYITGGFVVQ